MQPAVSYSYDALGDITYKSDTGTYSYGGGAGPHAVTSISGPAGGSYGYDADGNMINRNGTTIAWNSLNLPTQITQSGSNSSGFAYAPDKHRYYQSAVINGVTETTVYVGAFEAVTTGGVTKYRYHLSADSREVAEVDLSNSGSSVTEKISYILSDHLGSTDVVETTDVNGNMLSTTYMSFSAWGNRREPGTWLPPVGSTETQTDHNADRYGFTHQEMLDNVGIVHMNGRIYDPNLGRFLSVDPVFEFPTNTQSLNPYSYVLNNPLSMTDPTGYVADSCGTGQTSCPDSSPQSQSTTVHVSYTPTGSHIAISGTVTATALGNGNYAVTGSNKAVAQAFNSGAKATFGNGVQTVQSAADAQTKPTDTSTIGSPENVAKSRDPEPAASTVKNSVDPNAYYKSQGLVKVNGNTLTANIPYAVASGVSDKNVQEFETDTKATLNKTFSETGKPDLTISINLIRVDPTRQTPALWLNPCSSTYCHGGDAADAPVGFGEVFVKHWSTPTDAPHELLHTFGLWHQWDSTKSIMSYAHDRYMHYSDADRLINAYRDPGQ